MHSWEPAQNKWIPEELVDNESPQADFGSQEDSESPRTVQEPIQYKEEGDQVSTAATPRPIETIKEEAGAADMGEDARGDEAPTSKDGRQTGAETPGKDDSPQVPSGNELSDNRWNRVEKNQSGKYRLKKRIGSSD